MRIAVCLKQVLYTHLPFEIDPQGMARQKGNAPVYRLNEADRAALEEAIHWRKMQGGSGEVVVLTVGPARSIMVLHLALAAGADRAVHLIEDDSQAIDAYLTALALSRVIRDLDCDMVLCGTRSEDEGSGQVPPILAELLDLPQLTCVIGFEIGGDGGTVKAIRGLERGRRQIVESALPAVIALEAAARQPRYVSQRALQMARTRAIDVQPLAGVLQDDCASVRTVRVAPPRPRAKKAAAPVSSLSAADRLSFVMQGGVTPREEGSLLEGEPDDLAEQLLQILSRAGLLDPCL